MTEREQLLRAVCANPYEETTRLVFADWLDENGEEERAAAIRGAGEPLWVFSGDLPKIPAWVVAELAAVMPGGCHWDACVERGFVSEVALPQNVLLERDLTAVFQSLPVRKVWVHDKIPLDNSWGDDPATDWLWFPSDDPYIRWELPHEWYAGMPGTFPSDEAAQDWLSDRLVATHRAKAGLPALEVPT